MVLIENGEGYSSALGNIDGLTISETDHGYVGLFKSCEEQHLLVNGSYPELITIEFDIGEDIVALDNIKVNFVDQQGWVYFVGFRPIALK
jgi:hypothetical protein